MTQDDLYAEKADAYYAVVRSELVALIPENTKRLLDVGCGAGATGRAAQLRLRLQELVGIELFEPAATQARAAYDRVIVGDIETLELDFPPKHFDCILCADVLEHTKDPWSVLKILRQQLNDDGVLVASIPNIRHLGPLFKILFDRFEYEESGLLDKTHLHFFTMHTIRKMFQDTGFEIRHVKFTYSNSRKAQLLRVLSLGLLQPFLIYQFLLVVTKSPR